MTFSITKCTLENCRFAVCGWRNYTANIFTVQHNYVNLYKGRCFQGEVKKDQFMQ